MSALDIQIGGNHYKGKSIQPIEYIHANGLNYTEGAIVKYITRWREKNGYEDLLKIKHYVDLLIEMDVKYGKPKDPPKTPITGAALANNELYLRECKKRNE